MMSQNTKIERSRKVLIKKFVDAKFKEASIKISLQVPLREETATVYTLIGDYLTSSNQNFPSLEQFSAECANLYGSSLSTVVSTSGETQVITLNATTIEDKYTLEGEPLEETVCNMLLDCLLQPACENNAFLDDIFQQSKTNVIDDIKSEINNKRSYALRQAKKIAHEGELSAISYKGTIESVNAVTSQQAYEMYQKLLKEAYIRVYIMTPSDHDSLVDLIRSRLNFDCLGEEITVFAKSKLKENVRYAEEKMDIAQAKMVMNFKTTNQNSFAMSVFSMLYGQSPSSKLFENVREKMSLCYYCTCFPSLLTESFAVDAGVETQNIKTAEKEILHQLDLMIQGDFTEEELQEAKVMIINSYKGLQDTVTGLIKIQLLLDLKQEDETIDSLIEKFSKVTKKDVMEAAASLQLDTVFCLIPKKKSEKS